MQLHLKKMEWQPDPAFFETDAEMQRAVKGGMMALYEMGWRDFGELLTDIESVGIRIDSEYLEEQMKRATGDAEEKSKKFLEWASRSVCPDAIHMNPASQMQKRQLFFGGINVRFKKSEKLKEPPVKVQKGDVMELPWVLGMKYIEDRTAEFEPGYEGQTVQDAEFRSFSIENVADFVEEGKDKPLKKRDIKLCSLKLIPTEYTAKGFASGTNQGI